MNYKIFKIVFAIVVNVLMHLYIIKPVFDYCNISVNNMFEIGWWIELLLLIFVTILSFMTVETSLKRFFNN
jgi:hypothetical protein